MTQQRKNVLITGSTGMLGYNVAKALADNLSYNLYTLSHANNSTANDQHWFADLTDEVLLDHVLAEIKPEIVIHCAALVNVNACESDRDYAYKLHVKSTERICRFPSVVQFIYISTDSVFDGQRGDYRETDVTNPLNYYAKTKLEGEEVVEYYAKRYLILRSNIVGFHESLKNSLFEWGYSSLASKKNISGFENVFFNPLYCGYYADLVEKLLQAEIENGIYHVGSTKSISKYNFLVEIARFFGFEETQITPLKLDPNSMVAVRPLNTVLVTQKIEQAGFVMPDVEHNLQWLFNDFSNRFIYDK